MNAEEDSLRGTYYHLRLSKLLKNAKNILSFFYCAFSSDSKCKNKLLSCKYFYPYFSRYSIALCITYFFNSSINSVGKTDI